MCGIAGSIQFDSKETGMEMLDALAHRGPDDRGEYWDEDAKVFLGHQRLSIIDLSSGGHQPMTNEKKTIWVIFNGEIYNYKEVRAELEEKGYVFQSQSDTEILVHGYEEYGADIFKKIDGMWAIGLYDKPRARLLLSRDPAGIKPLYLYQNGHELAFASEIGAIAGAIPRELTIALGAVERYLAHGYLYGKSTIYSEIETLAPGTTSIFSLSTFQSTSERNYTALHDKRRRPMEHAVKEFETLFAASVRETLQADVPVGLFLSGGIDSSLVGYYAKQAGTRLQSFTVGFENQSFDESPQAASIAEYLGFPHEVLMMNGEDIANDIEHILDSFGEPFADMSVLPTYYMSKKARERGYKVILAGDGADELFGGYQTHYLPTISTLYQKMPRASDTVLGLVSTMLPGDFTKLGAKEKLSRFLKGARKPHQKAHAIWKQIFTQEEMGYLLTTTDEKNPVDTDFSEFFSSLSPTVSIADAVMAVDFMTFLPSSCLVKSDICPMQSGLEIRLPFLNKAIIDFAQSLPSDMKVSAFQTKKLLRAALAHSLPKEITRLPKQGFVPPLAQWLCTDLKPILFSTLSEEHVAKTGFLNYTYVSVLIKEHLEKKRDHTKKLWALMSLVRFFTKRNHA